MVIRHCLRPLIFIFTACLLCINTSNGLFIHDFSVPFVSAFLISLPTIFLSQKLRIIVQFFIVETIILLCLMDCYCLIYFGSPISPQILSIIWQSNYREIGEFLSMFVNYHTFLQWRILLLLLLTILFPLSYKMKSGKLLLCGKKCETTLLGLAVLFFTHDIPFACKFFQLFQPADSLQLTEGLIFRHYHETMPTPLHRLVYAWCVSCRSKQMLAEVKRVTLTATIDSCTYTSPHIVLIIGESYNKHHASLYGYSLPTTPLQEIQRNKGNLFVFENVVTPWNITSNVFWEMFSLWEHGTKESINNYPLFPMLFRRAGYEVNFFSNQYVLRGIHKSSTSQTGSFFLADKRFGEQLFSYRNEKATKYDIGLVRQVAKHVKTRKTTKYSLDIVHLIGQHFDYQERYPHSYTYFTEREYEKRHLEKEAKQIIKHYDNATHYNDIILNSLLEIYQQKEAIVVFVADHGEEVYDDLPVHGRLFQEPTAAQARQEFEVPMWIWCSESYQARHREIVEVIKSAQNKPFITERLPHLLLTLAGISCQWSDDSQNILHPQYKCGVRIIAGNTNYDKL